MYWSCLLDWVFIFRQERPCLYAFQANILWLYAFHQDQGFSKTFYPRARERYELVHIIFRVWLTQGKKPQGHVTCQKEVDPAGYRRGKHVWKSSDIPLQLPIVKQAQAGMVPLLQLISPSVHWLMLPSSTRPWLLESFSSNRICIHK